jgi:hypothetical protein
VPPALGIPAAPPEPAAPAPPLRPPDGPEPPLARAAARHRLQQEAVNWRLAPGMEYCAHR